MIYTTTSRAASLASANESNLPFVAWSNLAAGATLGGTTPATGGERENAVTGSTYDKWRAVGNDTDGEVTLSATFGSAPTVNIAAIAAHNLASLGGAAMVQYQGASRTNLLLRSEQFDNAAWTKINCTITANNATAPNGQLVADRITETSNSAAVIQSVTPAGGLTSKTFTFSVWLWTDAGQPTESRIYIYGATGNEVIQALDVTLTTTPTRYSVATTFSGSPASTAVVVRVDPFNVPVTNQYLYAWGAQLEEGAATSYIATTTVAVASTWYDWTDWAVPTDNSPMVWRFATGTAPLSWRFRFAGISSAETLSVGVAFIGQELIVPQGFYQGFSPVITPTEVQLQSNVSVGNELLGSSVIGRGSTLQASFTHLSPSFIRGADWLAFQRHFNDGGGFFFGWRPAKYPQDVHYCWRNGSPIRPTNSGPKDYMSADFAAQVHNAN